MRPGPKDLQPADLDLTGALVAADARLAAIAGQAAAASRRAARAAFVQSFGFANSSTEGDPVDPESVLGAVDRFGFALAADRATALAQMESTSAELRAQVTALAESCQAAHAFLRAFLEAAGSKTLTYTTEEDQRRTITGFVVTGEDAGLTIEVPSGRRPKSERIPLSALRGEASLRTFRLPVDSDLEAQRAAFLGWLALADHRRLVPTYVRGIDSAVAESGTGENGYPLGTATLQSAVDGLRSRDEAWARALRTELLAALRVVRGLRALSETRNTAAANHLAMASAQYADSLFVDLLR